MSRGTCRIELHGEAILTFGLPQVTLRGLRVTEVGVRGGEVRLTADGFSERLLGVIAISGFEQQVAQRIADFGQVGILANGFLDGGYGFTAAAEVAIYQA